MEQRHGGVGLEAPAVYSVTTIGIALLQSVIGRHFFKSVTPQPESKMNSKNKHRKWQEEM